MEVLKNLISQAMRSPTATAEHGGVAVEINGGVPIYSIADIECTATQAADQLDSLGY